MRDQNRVLVFDTTALASGMSANRVLGQGAFNTIDAGSGPNGLSGPCGMTLDVAGNRIWIADRMNNRVLAHDAGSAASGTPAMVALGQADFSANANATTATGLFQPQDVAFRESPARLFVADTQNSRVAVFDTLTTGAAMSAALGQPDLVTGTAISTTRTGLNLPVGLAFDGTALYVTDQFNHRVVAFKSMATGAAASTVIGATSFTVQGGGGGNASMINPTGLDFASGRLWVAEGNNSNHRVLLFQP